MPRWLRAIVQRLKRASCGLCKPDEPQVLPTNNMPTANNQTSTSTQQLLNPTTLTTTTTTTPVSTSLLPTPQSSLPIVDHAPHGDAVRADQGLPEADLPVHQAPRSKALLIGIHYGEHVNNIQKVKDPKDGWDILTTPGQDVKSIYDFLRKHDYDNFRILLDPPSKGITLDPTLDIYAEPTRDAILDGLKWLVHDARDGDRLFLHYSGHGDQRETSSSTESDGFDEVIVPLTKEGIETYIRDNEIADIIKTLKTRCKLLAVLDACHSGTMMDLEHRFPFRLSGRRPKLNTRFSPSNRLKKASCNQPRAATTPANTPIEERGPPSKRNTILKHTGTVQNMLRLPFDDNGPVIRIPLRQTGMYHPTPSQGSIMNRRSTQISTSTIVAPMPVHPEHGAGDILFLQRVMSPEPMESIDAASIQEEFRLPSLQIAQDPGPNDARNHTFADYQTPEQDDAKQPQVIAISACLDEENVFDDDYDGGLLTSTFIECMGDKANQNGIELGKMREFLLKRFMSRTKRVHKNCPPTPNEGKHCGNPKCKLPIIPPQPLFTSSVFLNPDLVIQL